MSVCILLILIGTYYLDYCEATSSSVGTITISCYYPLEILVSLTCTNNCTNPKLITYGNSPLTVGGLDPGVAYSVMINAFDGSHVVLTDQMEVQNITVMKKSGKCSVHSKQKQAGGKSPELVQPGILSYLPKL